MVKSIKKLSRILSKVLNGELRYRSFGGVKGWWEVRPIPPELIAFLDKENSGKSKS